MNDMEQLGRWLRVMVPLCIIIAFIWFMFQNADAQPTTHYDVLMRFNRGFDSWTTDSTAFYLTDGDSILTYLGTGTRAAHPGWAGDSLSYWVAVSATTISKTRNPMVMGCIYTSTYPTPICETQAIAHLVHAVDTARNSPGAVASISDADWAVILDSLRLEHGTGPWTPGGAGSGLYTCTLRVIDTSQAPDDTLTDVTVLVKDFSNTVKAGLSTGSNGLKAVFNLNDENLTFGLSANWYFQQTGLDSIAFPAKDTNLTLLAYKFAPSLLAGGDSCTLIIYTDVDSARAKITMHAGKAGAPEDSPVQDSSGVFLDRGELTPNPIADSNGVIQLVLVRTKATKQRAVYDIEVFNKSGVRIFSRDNYVIPDSASHVMVVSD